MLWTVALLESLSVCVEGLKCTTVPKYMHAMVNNMQGCNLKNSLERAQLLRGAMF